MNAKIAIGLALLVAFAAGCGASDEPAGGASAGAASAGGSAVGGGSIGGASAGGASAGGSNSGGSNSGGASAGGSSVGGGNPGGGSTPAGGSHPGGASAGGSSAGGAPAGGGASGGASAGGSGGGQPYKGVAFNLMGSSCDDLKTLGVSWYYAWSGTAPCTTAGVEFVPMIWGSWKKLDWVPTPTKAVAKGAKFLLGFNEPDGTGQANMSVEEAISLWPDFQIAGVQLGSPAVAGQEEWLPQFMTQAAANNLRVDFIALHWYGWNANACNDVSQLENKIKWAEQWQRPIWITEWSCRLHSVAVNEKFFKDALVMLKKHPRVERYAWFLSRSTGEFANAALLDGSGKPTGLGQLYVAAPATR